MSAGSGARIRTALILGVLSDIGHALALRYLRDGYRVVGTYRRSLPTRSCLEREGAHLVRCDMTSAASVRRAVRRIRSLKLPWSVFISCVGAMEPIGNFFKTDFRDWSRSVEVNALGPLRFLHYVYPLRRKGRVSDVIFFAGGGTNGPFTNYSAYCASKIVLIKMCELLADENKDLNPFIVGPGWVRTKIHDQTMRSGRAAGRNFERTVAFLASGDAGASGEDIYLCLRWCAAQGRKVSAGRNFSVKHDAWGTEALARRLASRSDFYKLRRLSPETARGA